MALSSIRRDRVQKPLGPFGGSTVPERRALSTKYRASMWDCVLHRTASAWRLSKPALRAVTFGSRIWNGEACRVSRLWKDATHIPSGHAMDDTSYFAQTVRTRP